MDAQKSKFNRIDILMPALSPAMADGKVSLWLKAPGDYIKAGDVIVEIETDKATMEVEAVDEGLLETILVDAGTTVKVNTAIARIISIDEHPEIRMLPQLSDLESASLRHVIRAIMQEAAKETTSALVGHQGKPAPIRKRPNKRIFIVHGHDETTRFMVTDFLRRIGLQPVVLHEQTNRGRTIIAKFIEEAKTAAFAVVLLTPDDIGGKKGQEQSSRARQNVVFEFGFFVGLLGPDRVVALQTENLEKPSDIDGVVYVSMVGDWQAALGRELQAGGVKINWNRLMGER